MGGDGLGESRPARPGAAVRAPRPPPEPRSRASAMAAPPRRAAGPRLPLPLLCLLLQAATAVLFAVFVRYNRETDAALWHWGNHSNADNEFYFRYPSECVRVRARGSKDPTEGALGCPVYP